MSVTREQYSCVLCYCFRILDDLEMYEQQKPFRLVDYVYMSSFLNQFLYKGVLGNLFGKLLQSDGYCELKQQRQV